MEVSCEEQQAVVMSLESEIERLKQEVVQMKSKDAEIERLRKENE